MAYSDNSSFVGVSLDDIFVAGLECSQLSNKTRVAVLETDGKTFLKTSGKAVLDCEVDLRTVREANLDILRETVPKTGAQRDRE